MYEGLDWSLGGIGLRLDDCYHEDRGDGVMVLVPPQVRAEMLVTTVRDGLRTSLRHYNEAASEAARLRLRVAVHFGDTESDGRGIVSSALTHAFRLLDAEQLKEDYYRVEIKVKETVDLAWIMVPGVRPARPDSSPAAIQARLGTGSKATDEKA